MSEDPYDMPHLHAAHAGPEPQPLQPAQQRIRTAWTADELMNLQFPDPKWAVPGLISEGVNLLAGPPKVGKSWLSLGLALSVAAGRTAMDTVPVDGGPVLYLALEDTPSRLQSRMARSSEAARRPPLSRWRPRARRSRRAAASASPSGASATRKPA